MAKFSPTDAVFAGFRFARERPATILIWAAYLLVAIAVTSIAMFDIVKQEGEKAFVMTAGASQLCKLIIGLAREASFRPIVTVRRDDQIAALKELGAAHVLNEKAPDFKTALREVITKPPSERA